MAKIIKFPVSSEMELRHLTNFTNEFVKRSKIQVTNFKNICEEYDRISEKMANIKKNIAKLF